VKVVDFGIAKAAANEAQKVTKTGMVVGTPEYMSPEQLSGDPLDARSDIYALALVAFNMFTGKLPFPGETMQESMIMRLTDEPKQLSQMKPDVAWPADLQAVMDKALARSADARYKNASEFAHDLVQAIDRMPVTSITAMGTEVLKRMSANSMHKAQTAATIQVETPKTRVATQDEAASRPSKSRPPASPAITPTKSKMPMMAAVGVLVVAGIGFGVYKAMSGPTEQPLTANTQAGAPTGAPATADSSPLSRETDSLLMVLNRDAEVVKEDADKTIILNKLQPLKRRLVTADQRVLAAVIEAFAGDSLCAPLRKVTQTDLDGAKAATVGDFNMLFASCKTPQ